MSLAGIEKWNPELWIGREDELNKAILADIYKTRAQIGKIWLLGVLALVAGIITWGVSN